jgi:hypothetical protein
MGAESGLNGIKLKCFTDDVTKPPCSLLVEGEKLTVSQAAKLEDEKKGADKPAVIITPLSEGGR